MPYIHATVEQGVLRGIDSAGVVSFLGVPYGASTAGENRLRAPQPAARWDGIRDATSFGPAAPQIDGRLGAPANLAPLMTLAGALSSPAMDEDCLRVNIWAPSGRQDDALPVLVQIHGGGYTNGSGNQVAFHGDLMATAANLVVVTVTHRLGLLGFLDLRELGEASSANAGLLDIVAALEWVQRNIHAFGGDPTNVTICGQSGGSGKVAALTAMPATRNLYARAIMMSGPFGRSHEPQKAAALRARTMEISGLSTVAELRAAPIEQLLEVQHAVTVEATTQSNVAGVLELDLVPGFGPSLDPLDLPAHSFDAEVGADLEGKELMIGWTTHEATFFLVGDPSYTAEMTAHEAAARVDHFAEIDGVTYADLAARFPHEAPHLILGRRLSWLMFEKASRRIAQLASTKASGVWAYEFRQPTEVLGGLLGATHALDIAYLFGTVDRIPLSGRSLERHQVSRDMMHAWANFAHQGNPGWEPWSSTETVHGFGTSYGPDLHLPTEADMGAPLPAPAPRQPGRDSGAVAAR